MKEKSFNICLCFLKTFEIRGNQQKKNLIIKATETVDVYHHTQIVFYELVKEKVRKEVKYYED